MSEWFYVPGFGETYVVNPYGEVWSRDRTVTTSSGIERRYKGRRLTPTKHGIISLSQGATRAQRSIDDLVREVFGHRRLDRERAEVWRAISGYGDRYEVSDYERVRESGGDVLPIVEGCVTLLYEQGGHLVPVRDLYDRAFSLQGRRPGKGDYEHVWRPVPGFPGYEVNLARKVRREGPGGRPIKVEGDVVHLSRDGKRYRRKVSALAREAFRDVYARAGVAV